jgi:cytochrome c oxidase subunit 3
MNTLTHKAGGHGHQAETDHALEPILSHQFDDVAQQSEASTLGMWLFLATELMFFGGLFTAFAIYRIGSPAEFALASQKLNVLLGCVNTMVLLLSSLTMALAVRSAQLGQTRDLVRLLLATMVLGAVFLGIKAVEWHADYDEHLIPGVNFQVPEHDQQEVVSENLNPGRMQMFFVLYFFMTGLHAIHLIIGIGMLALMAHLAHRNWFSGGGATQIEAAGLYWHFIDIVWVFLYPLLYLIEVRR